MSQIPDLLRIGEIPSNMAMEVETQIVEPVINTESFVRFGLRRSGFLHSDSKLLLSLDASSFTDIRASGGNGTYSPAYRAGKTFFPASIGISNLISRVRLLSGNTVIQEIDDFRFLENYRSMFVTNEDNKEKNQYLESKMMGLDLTYQDAETSTTDNRSSVKSIGVGLDNGECYDASYVGSSSADALYDKYVHRCQEIGNDPVYQVNISQLCPFLRQTQLPLYLFEEEVFIEITLCPAIERAQGSSYQMGGTAAEKLVSYTISPTETRMVVDYISYPEETMSAWAEANRNLTFSYFDYELSKFTVNQADGNNGFIRSVGGAGKLVTKMICGLNQDSSNEAASTGIIGRTGVVHPQPDNVTANNRVQTNLRYNDRYLYPITVTNDSYHFTNVVSAEGIPPFVNRGQYSGQGNATEGFPTITAKSFMGYGQDVNTDAAAGGFAGLTNNFFWQSFKLNRNERINQKGIELYQKYLGLGNFNHTIRVWLEVVKVATLRDGKLRSDYA